MLPEVRALLTLPFLHAVAPIRHSSRRPSFENKPLECYKSDRRPALGLLISGNLQVCREGVPGRWHWVFVPFRTKSHPLARLAWAWRVPRPLFREFFRRPEDVRPLAKRTSAEGRS